MSLCPQADLRINAFTDVEVNLVGEAAQVLGMAAPATPDPTPDSGAAATPTTPTSNGTPAAGDAKKPAAAAAESGEWNEEQESALVKAMKQFGKELSDRWDRVAEVVPGKNKAQCFKRFKELREHFRSKKGADAGGADE